MRSTSRVLHLNLVVPIVASVISLTVTVAHATTYFVRTSGDDTRDGLSPATAFASIRPAARLLQNPGDRLIVGPGTYNEGNIKPRGSGTAEAPIVLHADTTGELTGDPAGPVVIIPPNTPDATTGIIVYGRSHVIIEGFDVDGADDAGIQIRPHSRTGADSSNVTVRNNTVRNGRRKGIHVIAAGDVIVTGNRAIRNARTGFSILGGEDTTQRPQIANNIAEENRFGLVVQRALGGTVADNVVRNNHKGMSLKACDGLVVTGNEIAGVLSGDAANLTLDDNIFTFGGNMVVTGTTVVTKNEFTSDFADFDLTGSEDAIVRISENTLWRLSVYRAARLEVIDNDARTLALSGRSVVATDNRLMRNLLVGALEDLEVSRNRAEYIYARAPQLEMHDNELARWADILTATASIAGNRAQRLAIMRYHNYVPSDPIENSRGPYLVERNVTETALRFGDTREPLANVTARDNEVGTMLRAFGRGNLEVRGNQTRGISCIVSGADSRLTVSDNTSRDSLASGIIAIGATTAVIENNTSAESVESGLATRGIRNLTVNGNTFQSNPIGGISVVVPLAGDCNSNLDVAAHELVIAVRIALEELGLHTCPAADFSGDTVVTIDELVLAAGAAIGRPDPNGGTITIHSNRVENNGRFGIKVSTGGVLLASDNQVLRNEGIALALQGRGGQEGSAITGNLFGLSGAEGMMLNGISAARVRNNTIFSNRDSGILLRGAPQTSVVNNLIYANDEGIAIGLGGATPTQNVVVANNTIYANAKWGIVIGARTLPASDTDITNNIIDGNLHGGIAAETESGATAGHDFNLNNDPVYETIPASPNDFTGDPLFVAAAGTDGILGGEGFADDNLRLQPNTPARDAGSASAAELGITGSAIEGLAQDTGVVDVGFHYQ